MTTTQLTAKQQSLIEGMMPTFIGINGCEYIFSNRKVIMSAIDCHSHTQVGYLFGLPVYHPMVEIDDETLLNAGPSNFLIGGGGGEHSAMMIVSLDRSVYEYIKWFLKQDQYPPQYLRDFEDTPGVKEILDSQDIPFDNFIHTWSISCIADYHQKVQEYCQSYHPFKDDKHDTETIINLAIGEYVLRFGKSLLKESFHQEIERLEEKTGCPITPRIALIEPCISGYNSAGTVYYKTEDGRCGAKYGVSFFDECLWLHQLYRNQDRDLESC